MVREKPICSAGQIYFVIPQIKRIENFSNIAMNEGANK